MIVRIKFILNELIFLQMTNIKIVKIFNLKEKDKTFNLFFNLEVCK